MEKTLTSDLLFSDNDELDSLISNNFLTPATAYDLAALSANTYIENYQQSRQVFSKAISVLCRLALSADPDVSRAGLQGLFPQLAERLSDTFDPALCNLYDLAFSQVIDFCRRHRSGKSIDQALNRFGLRTDRDLINRKTALRSRMSFRCENPARYKKALVLSRVTLGADVAITSVVIAKLLEVFPNAEVIFIGEKIFADIFSGLPRFRVRHCHYPVGGGLIERISGWLPVLDIIDKEINDLQDAPYIIIDPDSRHTQLGLLPLVTREENYLLFESRSFQHPPLEKITSLTNHWLKQHLGGTDMSPMINLSATARTYARMLRSRLGLEKKVLTTVSLGVGGNNKKRLGPAFELELLKALQHFENNAILIFKGVGEDELKRTSQLTDRLSTSTGNQIPDISGMAPGDLPQSIQNANIFTWEGPLREYCALIAESDIHIGYDSSGQHIAGACGVATIDIFADESTPMFVKRWAPHGPGPVKTVRAYDPNSQDTPAFHRPAETDPVSTAKTKKSLKKTIRHFTRFFEAINRP